MRTLGTVKFWKARLGWGIINDGADDVFIHHADLPKSKGVRNLKEGWQVSFEKVVNGTDDAGNPRYKATELSVVRRDG